MLNRSESWSSHRRDWARSMVILLMMSVVIATVIALPASARKRARPMPFEEVATTWVGVALDQRYLVRLVLREDGTGVGGYAFLNEPPRVFRIAAWRYENGRVEIRPVPLGDPPSWVSPMKGSIQGVTMHLKATGDDWRIELVLRQEEELARRWLQLKGRMGEDPE